MKYLVLLTPAAGKKAEDISPHKVAEIKAVWRAYLAGTLREFYFSPAPPTVTLIYEVPDATALERELNGLPLVEFGLLDYQVIQLGPFLQFQALFDQGLMETS